MPKYNYVDWQLLCVYLVYVNFELCFCTLLCPVTNMSLVNKDRSKAAWLTALPIDMRLS